MVTGYSRLQIVLHWVVAGLILGNLLFADAMSALWREMAQGGAGEMTLGARAHIVAGIAVLALVVLRLVLRATRGAPEAPASSPLLERAAKIGHWVIYAVMLGMPITGLAAYFGGVDVLAEVHEGPLKALLWVLIVGHVGMAIYHHFVLKDGLLDRMRKPG